MSPEHLPSSEKASPLIITNHEIVIGGEHLDPFAGHVHHTGPFHYLNEARLRIMAENREVFDGWIEPVGYEIESLEYRRQLYPGDAVVVRSEISPKTSLWRQALIKDDEVMVQGVINLATGDGGHISQFPEQEQRPLLTTNYDIVRATGDDIGVLHNFEMARAAVVAERGKAPTWLRDEAGVMMFVHSIKALRYGREVSPGGAVVRSEVSLPRRTVLSCRQALIQDGNVIVEGVINLAAVNEKGKLEPIPHLLLELLQEERVS